jgi:hypothetical protein
MVTVSNEFNRLKELMDKVNMLEELFETAMAEDDRWTANKAKAELEEINRELTELENEP